jgi:hypothetical protein
MKISGHLVNRQWAIGNWQLIGRGRDKAQEQGTRHKPRLKVQGTRSRVKAQEQGTRHKGQGTRYKNKVQGTRHKPRIKNQESRIKKQKAKYRFHLCKEINILIGIIAYELKTLLLL